MRNKYNYGELVKISGMGKNFGEVKNRLGFIIRKDDFYEDYYVELVFGEKDWFNEESIERVLGEKRNKTEKYQVRFCTTKQGYELIQAKLKEKEPISNNKFKKLDKSNKDYNALFLSSRGKRISKRSVQNIIKSELVELVEAEGKESKKYHTHTLRHTGATLLYNEANANIFVLKIILGHESLDATQVYTHVSDKKLKELMQNFNILDRKE